MNKKTALILSLTVTILIFSTHYLISSLSVKSESVFISRVIDGDTLQLDDGRVVRLLNINAPEKGTINAIFATNFLKQYENSSVLIQITELDKYNRTLARIFAPDYLNLQLVSIGLASKFLVQESELNLFDSTEKEAIINSRGIWKKSKYFGCFKTDINKKEEYILLESLCGEINLNGWIIKDESRKTYEFRKLNLNNITLHSFEGQDNQSDLFWNSATDIWNNDRDSVYLFDSRGDLAYSSSYGY